MNSRVEIKSQLMTALKKKASELELTVTAVVNMALNDYVYGVRRVGAKPLVSPPKKITIGERKREEARLVKVREYVGALKPFWGNLPPSSFMLFCENTGEPKRETFSMLYPSENLEAFFKPNSNDKQDWLMEDIKAQAYGYYVGWKRMMIGRGWDANSLETSDLNTRIVYRLYNDFGCDVRS